MSYCNPQGVTDIHPSLVKDAIDNFKYLLDTKINEAGKSIDTLKSMSETERNTLFNDLWETFADKVMEKFRTVKEALRETNPTLTHGDLNKLVLEKYAPLKNNIALVRQRDAFLTEFTNSLADLKLNLTFKPSTKNMSDDELMDREYGEGSNDGIVIDKFNIDNSDLANFNLRWALSCFTQRETSESGTPKVINSWFDMPKTVPYDFVNRTLSAITLNQPDVTSMLNEFDKHFRLPSGRYKNNYWWGEELRNKLKLGKDKTLSRTDVKLITAFETYFKGYNYSPKQLIINKGGENNIMDTVNHRNELDAVDAWKNNVISAIMSDKNNTIFDDDKDLSINRNSDKYKELITPPKPELTNYLEKLEILGINLPKQDVLDSQDLPIKLNDNTTKTIKTIIEESYKGIVSALENKKVSPVKFDALYSANAASRFRNISRVYNELYPENKRFTILNAENKAQYMRQSQSMAAQQTLKLNNITNRSDIFKVFPEKQFQFYWNPARIINGEISYDPLIQVLFNEDGSRKPGSSVELVLQQGLRSREQEEGTKESGLLADDQLLYSTSLILNNIYPLAMNGDKTMSYGMSLSRPFMYWRDINGKNGKQNILDNLLHLFRDETDCAWSERISPRNIKTFSKEVYKLGVFSNILSKNLLQEFAEVGFNLKVSNPKEDVNSWSFTKNNTNLGSTESFQDWREKWITKNYKELQNSILEKYINSKLIPEYINKLEELNLIKLNKDDSYKMIAISKDSINKSLGQDVFEDHGEKKITKTQLEDLSRYVLVNYFIARLEQDKVYFEHASYMKDPFKRYNMLTAIKTQMSNEEEIVKNLSPKGADKSSFLPRIDKRQDTISNTNSDKYIRTICHAEHIFIQDGYQEMAEKWYEQKLELGYDKKEIEKELGCEFNEDNTFKKLILKENKPTGLVANYVGAKGADSYSHMLHDFYWNYRQRLGDMKDNEYNQMEYDWAYNIEGLSNLNEKEYPLRKFDYSEEIKNKAKEILKKYKNISPDAPLNSIKPQYSGFTEKGVPAFAKTAPSYMTWRIVEGTASENMYLDAIEAGIDWIMPESAQKVGNPNNTPYLTNLDGSFSLKDKSFPIQNWHPDGMGKQSEITEHDSVKGSQEAKLIYSNAIANPELDNLMRQSIISKNQLTKTLTQKVKNECAIDDVNNDPTKFYNKLENSLRQSGNSEDKLQIFKDKDTPFDASSIKSQIEHMCWSMFNDDIINPHHPGIQATQIHSIGMDSVKWAYLNPETGLHEQLNERQINERNLTQKDLQIISEPNNLPRIKDEKIQPVTVIMGWPFKNLKPSDIGLDKNNPEHFSKGVWDLTKAAIDQKLLHGTMIRIPTPSINSIHYVHFPKVFDPSRGNIVSIGSGIVVIGGSDFDGDKMQVFFRGYRKLEKDLTSKEFRTALKSNLEKNLQSFGIEPEQLDQLLENINNDLIFRINEAAWTDKGRDKHIESGEADEDHESLTNLANGNSSNLELYKTIKSSIQDYKNSFNNNSVKLVSINPEENSIQGNRNKLMDYREQFLSHPSNYSAVTTPLLLGDLEEQAKKIDTLLGIKNEDSDITKTHELIPTLNARRVFVEAKKGLGPAARAFSQHVWNQVAQFRLTGSYRVPGPYRFIGVDKQGLRSIFNPFTEQNVPDLGSVYANGKLISEVLANLTQGILEAAKNPTVFKLGVNMDNIGAIFNQLMQGADHYKISLISTQPIVRQFIQERKLIQSFNYKTNIKKDSEDNQKLIEKLVTKLLSRYGTNLRQALQDSTNINKLNIKELEDGLSKLHNQGAFLIKYLEVELQGSPAFTFNQRLNSDTVAIKTFMELKKHLKLQEKVDYDNYITNPENIDKTFIQEIDNATQELMSKFDKYFMYLHPAFSELNNKILDFASTRTIEGENKNRILNNFVNFQLNYLLQSLPNPNLNNNYLSTEAKDLIFGENSLPTILSEIKKSPLGNLNLWKFLQPLLSEEGAGNTLRILKMNPTPYETKLLIDEINTNQALAKNPKVRRFVDNIAKYNIFQTGLTNNRNSINKIVPYELHKDVVKFVFDLYKENKENGTMSDLINPEIQNKLWDEFFRNNALNKDLCKRVYPIKIDEEQDESGDFRRTQNKNVISLANTHQATKYDYITHVQIKNNGDKKIFTPNLFRKIISDKNTTYYQRINAYGVNGVHIEINPENNQSIHPQNNAFDENNEETSNYIQTLLDRINFVSLPKQEDMVQGDLFAEPDTELDGVSTIPKQITKMSDLTDHSGGAYGADTDWDIIGRKEFGLTDFRHYREEGNASLSKRLRDLGVKATIVSKEDLATGYAELEKVFGKKFSKSIENDLKARNYLQVKNSDGVFAIGTFKSPEVNKSIPDNTTDSNKSIKSYKFTQIEGGTNAAVQMAIAVNKPVHVFDLTSKTWNVWNGTKFVQEETPILTKNFAGIGTRDIENYSVMKDGQWVSRPQYKGAELEKIAQNAIRDVYKKTQESIQNRPQIKGINIYTKSDDILGRALTNPNWGSLKDGAKYFDVETAYKAKKSKNPNASEALKEDMNTMYNLISKKFMQNPELVQQITDRGGIPFLEASEHTIGVKNSRWEGKGINSNFIKVLMASYNNALANQPTTPSEPINWQDKISEIYQQKYGNALEKNSERHNRIITRTEVKQNPKTLYVFGDNLKRTGLGGQAKEMRGELNTKGIATKKEPNNYSTAFMSDSELELNKKEIREDVDYVISKWNSKDYNKLVIPQIGVGLAKLPEKAPETYKFLQSELQRLEDYVNSHPTEKQGELFPTKSKEEFVSKAREIYKVMKQANESENSILDAIKCL